VESVTYRLFSEFCFISNAKLILLVDIIEGDGSAGIYECGPEEGKDGKGWAKREGYGWPGEKSRKSMEMVEQRSRKLHYPPGQVSGGNAN